VEEAEKKLQTEYEDPIINTICYVGLSLNPNSSKDYELKIYYLPDITVGDYIQVSSASNPIIPKDNRIVV